MLDILGNACPLCTGWSPDIQASRVDRKRCSYCYYINTVPILELAVSKNSDLPVTIQSLNIFL